MSEFAAGAKQKHFVTIEQWEAMNKSDAHYDGRFYFGNLRNRLFCKPSCPAPLPKFNQVLIFQTAAEALAAGFYPCRLCCPTGRLVADHEWVRQVDAYLDVHYTEALSLERIASQLHGTPRELKAAYETVTFGNLMDQLHKLRVAKAKQYLQTTNWSMEKVAKQVGYTTPSTFSKHFRKLVKMSPSRYKHSLAPAGQIELEL